MIHVEDWGIIGFRDAWQRQSEYVEQIRSGKRSHTLILCEHPTVITLGRAGNRSNILLPEEELERRGIDVVEINRGGDVTLHTPGQLVGYPLFNLSAMKEDLHWFLREIEQTVIDIVAEYGVESGRVDGLTGVWIGGERKICAIGLGCSRWISYHGFALNTTNILDEFGWIIPCGIEDKGITSLAKETGEDISMEHLKELTSSVFTKKFSG
ncbi:MAG: lipoyl(octanoyl) transferase LipB [Candidatus Kapabacteria bacterium]|nr:lipoyl(octanoyl) transferase LipB [Candidatus Kapabacteria bacterium]